MHDVKGVLDFLGYDEVRPPGGDWCPLSQANGQCGTTDETNILDIDHEEGLRLVDRDTGDLLATARKSSLLPMPETQTIPEKGYTLEVRPVGVATTFRLSAEHVIHID